MYNCKKWILKAPPKFIKCNCSDEYKDEIRVDMCVAAEVAWLWDKGIKTRGCCCGHGRELGFIQVTDNCIEQMRKLGYQNYIYADEFGGIEREDAFIPQSTRHYFDGYSEGYLG